MERGCVNYEHRDDYDLCLGGECIAYCSTKCKGYKSCVDAAKEEVERREKYGIKFQD